MLTNAVIVLALLQSNKWDDRLSRTNNYLYLLSETNKNDLAQLIPIGSTIDSRIFVAI